MAMAKQPEDRYTRAADVAVGGRGHGDRDGSAGPGLVGLPFRMLRPNADADVLGDVLKVMLHVKG